MIIAVKPQIKIVGIVILEVKEADNGKANEIKAPLNDTPAAKFPFRIKSSSLIGVDLTYKKTPKASIKQEIARCKIIYGTPARNAWKALIKLIIL